LPTSKEKTSKINGNGSFYLKKFGSADSVPFIFMTEFTQWSY
jgi:hypothetical protein